MRRTTEHLAIAKRELATSLDRYVANPGVKDELAQLIAKFALQVVRGDRTHRYTKDGLAKVTDVFFTERAAAA